VIPAEGRPPSGPDRAPAAVDREVARDIIGRVAHARPDPAARQQERDAIERAMRARGGAPG